MTTTVSTTDFIAEIYPFNCLANDALKQLVEKLQPVRYQLGETIILRDRIPTHVIIICRGQVRLLGCNPRNNKEVTLAKLESKSIVGANSIVRQVYSETAIASTDVDCLVEVLNGMETVKSQNIEMRSRMAWQERYGHFISAGFKAVKLSAVAGSLNTFLNKLSTLLVLWMGAYLVLEGKLTLGELIAFGIIAGYVTNPLMNNEQSHNVSNEQ